MKKFKLNLEELKVQSFNTNEKKSTKGTVQGNAGLSEPAYCTYTGCETEHCETLEQATLCQVSCGHTYCNDNTCDGVSCGGTCGGNTCDHPCS